MNNQKDRIEAAIRHIQTASDVDPWAMELAVEALKAQLPSAQPEITDEQAIEHLQSTGWMQNHDREMYDMGLKKQLADDSGSYDSLLPSAQPERLTDDDFETIRIHLNAYKEKLCNQQRWKEAEEYQRIIDRFMTFASVHPNLQPTCNELATDTISRQAAVDAIDKLSDEPIGYLEAAIDALVDLPSAQPEPHYDEWCTDCKEYDHERHCCPRWNRVIRETLKDAQPNTDHIYAELSKVYNVKGLPDAAIGIIGDLMLSLDGPSAQPEIIRCKDCKFYTPMNRETKTGICRLLMHQNFGDDWYCAGAERRTE